MSMEQLTDFFLWMTIINFGIFLFSVIMAMIFKKLVKRMHSKFFGMSEEHVSTVIYAFFGVYKLGIILLNVAPLVALLIIAER